MAKIPFNVQFRPQIESGEYKVETFSGYPVTIYRWDFDDGARTPIMGSYVFEDSKEYVGAWNEEGHFDLMSPNDLDLFLITPEPELSEFEKGYMRIVHKMKPEDFNDEGLKIAKEEAAELLDLARKELEPEVLERLDAAYKNQDEVVYENGKRDGKAEALKDLPRWKKCEHEMHTLTNLLIRSIDAMWIGAYVKEGQYYIPTNDLILKLPGFKENEI